MQVETTSSLHSALRLAIASVAIFFVTLASIGWLYWTESHVLHWIGPKVHDALPLDELPSHDSVPVIVYLAVFALVATVLGGIARFGRLERATAALVLALGVGVLYFLVDAVSIFIVRQIPFSSSVHDAVQFQSIYLAAACAGLGGALLGMHPPSRRHLLSMVVVYATTFAGLLDVLSGILPHSTARTPVLRQIAAGLLPPLAVTLVVPIGVLLLFAARGLARRNRHAWQLAVGLLFASSVLHLLHNLHYGIAIFTGIVAVLLVARRQDFAATSDPGAHPRAAGRLVSLAVVSFAFGFTTRVVHLFADDLPVHLKSVAIASLQGMLGIGKTTHHGFSWASFSQLAIVLIGVVWAVAISTAPWRHRFAASERDARQARSIIRIWGVDSLAPFAIRKDKEFFFWTPKVDVDAKEPTGFLAYRVVRGVALVTGDPVGPPGVIEPTLSAFLGFAHARGWRVAVVGASGGMRDVYRSVGLHDTYHGDEAIINIPEFSLEGGKMKSVRQAAHRVPRKGYTSEIVMASAVGPSLRGELAALDEEWLGNRVRKGFVMELDAIFGLEGDDAVFVVGRDPEGSVVGFLHLAVCHASRMLSLSTMPRRGDAPNGFNAWLIVSLVSWARDHGYTAISLNFSPFAGLLDSEAELSSLQRVEREALLRIKGVLSLQLDNLQLFNRGFAPRFEPRYCIFERRSDLPRVVIAAMAAEGYLPFADRLRGWGEDNDSEDAGLGHPLDPSTVPAIR